MSIRELNPRQHDISTANEKHCFKDFLIVYSTFERVKSTSSDSPPFFRFFDANRGRLTNGPRQISLSREKIPVAESRLQLQSAGLARSPTIAKYASMMQVYGDDVNPCGFASFDRWDLNHTPITFQSTSTRYIRLFNERAVAI